MKKSLLFVLLLSLISCGKETERDRLGDAQNCLDGITAANPDYTDTCLEKIADIQTPAADSLRCSGAFVKEGFTDATQLTDTFATIKDGVNGSNLPTFLSLIIFDGRNASYPNSSNYDTYYNFAKTSSSMCASAKQKVGTLITTFSFLGNAIIKLGCDANAQGLPCTCGTGVFAFSGADSAAMGTYLTLHDSSRTQLYSDLGTLVINTYLISCAGTTVASLSLCENVNGAVTDAGGTTNPGLVGMKFIIRVTNLATLPNP